MSAHLTSVKHMGPARWEPSCDCGWRGDTEKTKREAAQAAWQHWAAYPVVTGPDSRAS